MNNAALGVSFGGTKLAAGLIGTDGRLVALSPRMEWRREPRFLAKPTGATVLTLAWALCDDLLQHAGLSRTAVVGAGFAWPGPGRYRQGLVSATFIPGFERPQPLFEMFSEAAGFCSHLPSPRYACALDASARAAGEITSPGGRLNSSDRSGCSLLINIATGIAGSVVRDGKVVLEYPEFGETYGQWGRYLFYDLAHVRWRWRPTVDGSVPPFSADHEVRLTDRCGGPAIARMWARVLADNVSRRPCQPDAPTPEEAKDYLGARNTELERRILSCLSTCARREATDAVNEVCRIGSELGSATSCLCEHLGLHEVRTVVFAGGVGENLAAPQEQNEPDRLLESFSSSFNCPDTTLTRSRLGLRAELRGAVPAEWI